MFKIPNILDILSFAKSIINLGKKVWHFLENTGIKDTETIDEKSSPQDINQISMALYDIRKYTVQISNPIIDQVKDDITAYKEELLMRIQDKSNIINQYTYRTFEQDVEDLSSDIEEYWENKMYKKISLDNVDCLNILKMPAGNRKQDAMQEFVSKTLKDIAVSYTSYISKRLIQLYDDFEINMRESIQNVEELLHSYQQMDISLDNKDVLSYEQQVLNADIKIFIYDKLLNELE